MPTSKNYNLVWLRGELKEVLTNHQIPPTEAGRIVNEFDTRITNRMVEQGIDSKQFNDLFEEKSKSAGRNT